MTTIDEPVIPSGKFDMELYKLCLEKMKETDETSFKLMGLVPVLSGISVYALFTKNIDMLCNPPSVREVLFFWVTGIFGAFITFLIYRWELRNIEYCIKFEDKAVELEKKLDVGEGVYHKIKSDPPKLLGLHFGKKAAEHSIYWITIVFWLSVPVVTLF